MNELDVIDQQTFGHYDYTHSHTLTYTCDGMGWADGSPNYDMLFRIAAGIDKTNTPARRF